MEKYARVFWGVLAAGIPFGMFSLLLLFLLHVHNEPFVDLYIIFNCNWGNFIETIIYISSVGIIVNVLALSIQCYKRIDQA
ncbi:hypothetical protein [Lactiplantibacillus plantarum]|uniref:hypothetical protein n=1 Tax=Lactiplantibacillus plantarum TaxID=1590 RepID=UPI0007B54883|nr:hypothetical protein [Lactiplantibacillus plantarum]